MFCGRREEEGGRGGKWEGEGKERESYRYRGEKGVITMAGLLNIEGGNLNTLGTICKWRFFYFINFW